jgi:hypothetical protein
VYKKAYRFRESGVFLPVAGAKIGWFIFVIALLSSDQCQAQETSGDGLYGRLNGDLTLSAGLGAAVAIGHGPKYACDLRARYLDTIGILVAPEWAPRDTEGAVAIALDLRPLFLARFFRDAYFGRAWVDLVLDSLGFEIGAWLGPFDRGLGAAFLLGSGVDVPLSAHGDSGFWFRLSGRYIYASLGDQAAPRRGKSEVSIIAALLFRTTVDIGLASWEPNR